MLPRRGPLDGSRSLRTVGTLGNTIDPIGSNPINCIARRTSDFMIRQLRPLCDAQAGRAIVEEARDEESLQALTIDPERILSLHAVGIFGNSMPGDRLMSRRQRRWQGHDELLLILWIGYRNAGRDCLPTFSFDFHAREFRDNAFAKIQLDLRGGDLARNIGCGANSVQFGMGICRSSKHANRQNCEGTYRHRIPGHANSFL
jgi:hypothetical protein